MTPPTYAPGDRVWLWVTTAAGTPSRRHATVLNVPDPDSVRVVLGDGVALVVGPDALKPLPPASRKRSKPGQGRHNEKHVLRKGAPFAVAHVTADGESTPFEGYTVTEITAGRIVWTAASGERIVMLGETQEATPTP